MKHFHIAMILAATALMQIHGIRFWSDFVGPDTGWVWSIVLEASALWLWANHDHGSRLALVPFMASVLVLSGPLVHIIQPPLQAAVAASDNLNRHQQAIAQQQSHIEHLENSLASAVRNSETRKGWLTEIQTARSELQVARDKLLVINNSTPDTQGLWPWVKAIMQAFALIVIWSVSVRAISEITKFSQAIATHKAPQVSAGRSVTQSSQKSESPAGAHAERTETNMLAIKVNQALDKVLDKEGITQAEWGNRKGFTPKNISLVRTHAKRVNQGMETAPVAVIKQMAATLGVK